VVIFIVKTVNFIVETFLNHISDKIKEKKVLLSLIKTAAQAILIALVIYISNGLYWSRAIDHLVPPLDKKPINTFSATVEIVITSGDLGSWHFADRGGSLIFTKKDRSLLVASSDESWGRPVSTNEYLYRAVFNMDAMDSAVGKPIEMLKGAEYVTVSFDEMPPEAQLAQGIAVCVINSEFRFKLIFPKQKAEGKNIVLHDLDSFRKAKK